MSKMWVDLNWVVAMDDDSIMRHYPCQGTFARTKSGAIKKWLESTLNVFSWRWYYRHGYRCVRVEVVARRIK